MNDEEDDIVLRPPGETLHVRLDDDEDGEHEDGEHGDGEAAGGPAGSASDQTIHVRLDDEVWAPEFDHGTDPGDDEPAADPDPAAAPAPAVTPAPAATPGPTPAAPATPIPPGGPAGPPPGPPRTPFPTPLPTPGPPVATLDTTEATGWRANLRQAKTWYVVGAAAAAFAVIAVTVAVLASRDPGTSPDVLVTDGSSEVAGATTELEEAALLADFQAVGTSSATRTDQLDDLLGQVDEVSGEQTREAVQGLLDAEAALVGDLAQLEALGDDSLDQWPDLEASLREGVAGVADAQAELPDRLQEASSEALDVEALRRAVVRADDLITEADEALTAWREETAAAEMLRDAGALTLLAYADEVRALLDRYDGLRSDLSDFTDELDVRPVSVTEARIELDQAAAARQQVRTQLAAITPPESMGAAHAGLVSVLDRGIDGVRAASEGLRQFEFDLFILDVRDTPGWATFVAESDFNTTSFDQSRATWESALDAEGQRIRSIPLPERPPV